MPPKKKKTPESTPIPVYVRGERYELDGADPQYLAKAALCACIEVRNGTCDQLLIDALRDRPLLDMNGVQIWPRNA